MKVKWICLIVVKLRLESNYSITRNKIVLCHAEFKCDENKNVIF